jgi:hypothetical protein
LPCVAESKRLRIPRNDSSALVEPPFSCASQLLNTNAARLRTASVQLGGQDLAEMAAEARRKMVEDALSYSRQYRDVPLQRYRAPDVPLVLCGHQTELGHPGVWFKHFAVDRIAAECAGCGIHLLVDNDLLRWPGVQVPTGVGPSLRSARVLMDRPAPVVPGEERAIVDQTLFGSFAQRVAHALGPWVADPLIHQLWPDAIGAARRHGNLGRALAEARHRCEQRWGLETLELPISRVCDAHLFRRFVVHILFELPRWCVIHNQSLAEYRQRYRLRSKSHPVPELASTDSWHEAPFWIWSSRRPLRQPMYVQCQPGVLRLRDAPSLTANSAAQIDLDARRIDRAVEQLEQAERHGIKIRPRALLTTMYARLLLSDLFVHGVGGGTYDELTDTIMTRFLNVTPPEFMVVTATFRLPVARPPVDRDDIRQISGDLRELWFHPERDLAQRGRTGGGLPRDVELLICRKRALLANMPPKRHRKAWHDEMETVNGELRSQVTPRREALIVQRHELAEQLRQAAILGSRDYSFCLFPEPALRRPLLDLAGQSA